MNRCNKTKWILSNVILLLVFINFCKMCFAPTLFKISFVSSNRVIDDECHIFQNHPT